MVKKNQLRLWAVWDNVINRIELCSESYSACEDLLRLAAKNNKVGLEILRFDLSPLYYDRSSVSDNPLKQWIQKKNNKQKNNER